MRYVALLRGINVNPATALAMADLRALLERLGYGNVRTHLRSGNALFTADGDAGSVAAAIERGLREELGLSVAVIVRTAEQLRGVVEHNPLEVRDPARFAVVFLSRPPDREGLASIDPAAYAPEEMRAGERELYVYFPDGLRRPKLPPLLDRHSAGPATMRNWNTVTRLLSLAEDL
ncbi:DUF1697 domain-containing protein [Microbispora bryophytorum]|uniref:DUF1697 domain-containing protein n=1 Tax=Microbispora bryophytorum TaxID=1460882 RepID=A0A8H9H2K7_9ACTN|nr:DUF1697 domain-containing protein [Microbispora bryophytorum]MBD3139101.1 DUF1697 domain-containing protein [Microbispora bryophytorum]TQS03168.1 DUF1697 domain-containing protein [Microbispora bryophytorum]GGO09293.1 hypothetical protein GCM10011574_24620 [Microbispora bryophytorum]